MNPDKLFGYGGRFHRWRIDRRLRKDGTMGRIHEKVARRVGPPLLLAVVALVVGAPSASAHNGGAYGGYPFITDYVYVKDVPGLNDNYALNRLEAAGIDIRWTTTAAPARGITLVPDSTLTARTGWAGVSTPVWVARWSTDHWEWATDKCTIRYQTGLPSRKTQFILAHEAMHCLGHWNHVTSTTALMRPGTKGWETYYTARSWEIDRLRYLYRLNY